MLNGLTSPESKRAYDTALDQFREWCERQPDPAGFTKATVQRWRADLEAQGLSAATVNLRLSAVRKLALEAADNGLLDRDTAAAIARAQGPKMCGTHTGRWLTLEQAENLLAAPNPATLKGLRDRALLAALVGSSLRRKEAVGLDLEHIQQRDGRWTIPDLLGKGGRIRTVPMPAWCKCAMDVWTAAAGISMGPVFRPVLKGGRMGAGRMSAQAVWEVVRLYGERIGVPELAPHDCRRTFAKLAHRGRAALEQIQLSLGHASVQTTERYLGVRQDLTDAPCDHLGLRGAEVSA
ncbi:MAG: tyrosine-type recombinase/integrase [Acidobacteria bacterium]|nr:tyrosine-type recombinase/integrase [Acidobacteriota bacterium]